MLREVKLNCSAKPLVWPMSSRALRPRRPNCLPGRPKISKTSGTGHPFSLGRLRQLTTASGWRWDRRVHAGRGFSTFSTGSPPGWRRENAGQRDVSEMVLHFLHLWRGTPMRTRRASLFETRRSDHEGSPRSSCMPGDLVENVENGRDDGVLDGIPASLPRWGMVEKGSPPAAATHRASPPRRATRPRQRRRRRPTDGRRCSGASGRRR